MTVNERDTHQFPPEAYGADMTFDIESNGLLEDKLEYKKGELLRHPAATRIWMSCHYDDSTGVSYDFIDDEILKTQRRALIRHNRTSGRNKVHLYPMSLLPQFWEVTGVLTGHNSIKFDFALVSKLMSYYLPRDRMRDTLLISQTLNCDREYVQGSTSGPHSVESWALRLNKGSKVEHEDWMNFSIDMYKRCWRDVEIQAGILVALQSEIKADKVECGIDWTKAIHTEHMAAFWISYSERWGFPCDVPYTKALVQTLDDNLESTEDELLPNMPFRLDTSGGGMGTLRNWEEYAEIMLKSSGLSRLPLGWCWPEDGRNRQQPIWEPFKIDGEYKDSVTNYFNGKDAEDEIPAEPEQFFIQSVKAKKAKYDKEGILVSEEVLAVKGIRARKAREPIPAKPRKTGCYEDEAGLTDPPIHRCKVEDVLGPFTRIMWINYNLGSNDQVIEYLQRYTPWTHTEETDKGNPRLTEDSFDSIGGDGLGVKLKNYLIDKSRRTNILNFTDPSKGWLNKIREDGRITPINHTMGTPTARSRHANLVNVPSGGARYGNEMRTCWTAYENGLLLGSDAAGLEMRMLANEMDDDECTKEIVEGDIHTVIWDLILDLVSSRGVTKSVEYAMIYGGADEKLGSLADVDGCREYFASREKLGLRGWETDEDSLWRHTRWHPKKESLSYKQAQDTVCGGIMRSRIMKGLKPLGDCIDRITKQSEKGYLVGLDGRKLIVRSSHSALNLKLQSTGAILMKTALVTLMERLENLGLVKIGNDYLPNKYVELFTFYHDEYQIGIPKESISDEKVLTFNLSDYDLTDKVGKKSAKEFVSKLSGRFHSRERKRKGIIWSGPVVDLEAGTATLKHSIVGQLCVETFEKTGKDFKINCEVTGDYLIGLNWKDCH